MNLNDNNSQMKFTYEINRVFLVYKLNGEK